MRIVRALSIRRAIGVTIAADDHGTGDLPTLFQAYAEYLVPVGENGISVKGGRFATPIGAESFRQDSNFNITRGANWALQPVNHTGVLVSGKCTSCGIDWLLGVVNGYSDTMSDRDNEKGFLGGLKYSRETWAFATNIFYGGDSGDFAPWAYAGIPAGTGNGAGRSGDKIGVFDHVLSWNPTDRFSAWANYDYYWVANTNSDVLGHANVHALALASRYGITDATGVALRGEYQTWNLDSGGQVRSELLDAHRDARSHAHGEPDREGRGPLRRREQRARAPTTSSSRRTTARPRSPTTTSSWVSCRCCTSSRAARGLWKPLEGRGAGHRVPRPFHFHPLAQPPACPAFEQSLLIS